MNDYIHFAALVLVYFLIVYLTAIRRKGQKALPWCLVIAAQAASALYFQQLRAFMAESFPWMAQLSDAVMTAVTVGVLAAANTVLILGVNLLFLTEAAAPASGRAGAAGKTRSAEKKIMQKREKVSRKPEKASAPAVNITEPISPAAAVNLGQRLEPVMQTDARAEEQTVTEETTAPVLQEERETEAVQAGLQRDTVEPLEANMPLQLDLDALADIEVETEQAAPAAVELQQSKMTEPAQAPQQPVQEVQKAPEKSAERQQKPEIKPNLSAAPVQSRMEEIQIDFADAPLSFERIQMTSADTQVRDEVVQPMVMEEVRVDEPAQETSPENEGAAQQETVTISLTQTEGASHAEQNEEHIFSSIQSLIDAGQNDEAIKYLRMVAFFGKNTDTIHKAKAALAQLQS